VEVASCHKIGGFNVFLESIVGNSEVKVASCQRIGGL